MAKTKIYASDFETLVDDESILKQSTRVWCAAINEIHSDESTMQIFNNIGDWFKYLMTLPSRSKIYFHNLDFDITFILCFLNKINYTYCDADVKTGRPKLAQGYSVIGSSEGHFYQLAINFGKSYVLIRDSLKLINGKLAKLGKDLKVDEKYWKIEEPDDFYRLRREEDHTLTDEEIKYITNDVMCLCKIMLVLEEIGMTKSLTAGSYALKEIIKSIYNDKYPDEDETSPYYFKNAKRYFRKIFPELDPQVDKFLRQAYKGGFTYNNTNGEIQKCRHWVYDVNSEFPSMMAGINVNGEEIGGVFPVGHPTYFKGELPKRGLYIVRLRAMFVVKPDHIPFIQLKHHRFFLENEFIKDSKGYETITLCKPDFELFFEQYDVLDYEILDGYVFSGRSGIFKSFVDKFYKMKEQASREGNISMKLRAKSVLNSGYGKLSTRGEQLKAHYEFTDEGALRIKTHDGDYEDIETVYLPAGIFVTAYARGYLIRNAQRHFEDFCYSDTDSLHMKKECPDLWIDKYALGAWDCEEDDIVEARYIRQKTYIEIRGDGSVILKACGMPDQCKDKFIKDYGKDAINKFEYGLEVEGKLSKKKVAGGTILYETTFAIKQPK